ncbi:ATP-grasp domain-containing protein [Mycobacterium sp. CVI_P3]|uniref:ATP-grasp domain-containing protein n=1 Tax=Mycobacterium pinniadriaticum TaxID=2994102 RepID=A0ABT3SDN9_9MYCO|nr:biotin carboxylase N-terminal domain-containing protein [Mycobacterium pinniadriaticum]MCX2930606.1 ATP-grasp domain-containing protein [Mycobacterium pinniadriaticum]MCX2937030.1 ATP-grasp domain-containing protein [Mycobacterium pinniadriaticum]
MKRLLIANRGEVASRVARAARARGIRTVALYSDPDATLPYLNDVDESLSLPGESATDTYLNIAAVLDAGRRTGCDAVHPGYGFLAESAEFAEAVAQAGMTFVGPAAECVAAMGSKVRAKDLARKTSVPVLPDAVIDPDTTDLLELGDRVGYPLLVKASAGGGGRGIRPVNSPDKLTSAVTSAQREAKAFFGDETVFLERFLEGPRHIEIQILGDIHGNVIHLGDRECSVQRRHQKILEECPASLVDPELRTSMAAAAVRLASEIGYVGAGTCEFLVQGDEYFFLEMNTRLQVEHTVTEQVTGLDLVALQLDIAAGAELPLTQSDVALTGHSIQARVCAEDPHTGWLPSAGYVRQYWHPADDGVRYEDGIASGTTVSPLYDSMITKVIATGATRDQAASVLRDSLATLQLHGPATNVRALLTILDDEEYRRGEINVNWLEHRPDLVLADPLSIHAVAAAVAAAVHSDTGRFALPAAWSNSPRVPVQWTLADDHGTAHELHYLPAAHIGEAFPLFRIDDAEPAVRTLARDGDRWRIEVDGITQVVTVSTDGELGTDAEVQVWVNGPTGQTYLTIAPRFAEAAIDSVSAGPTSPMPGTVASVHVTVGQEVAPGDRLVVVEAMKMEHVIRAGRDAVVARVLVEAGQAVTAGRALVELEERP